MCKGERMTGSVYRTTCKLLYSLLRMYCVITTVYKYKSERTLHWTVLKILWTWAFNPGYEKRSDQQLMIGHSKFCLFNVATALQDGYRAMNTYSDWLEEPRRRSGGEQGINSTYKDNSVMPLSSNTTLFESRMRTDSITCKKTYKTQPLFLQKLIWDIPQAVSFKFSDLGFEDRNKGQIDNPNILLPLVHKVLNISLSFYCRFVFF